MDGLVDKALVSATRAFFTPVQEQIVSTFPQLPVVSIVAFLYNQLPERNASIKFS